MGYFLFFFGSVSKILLVFASGCSGGGGEGNALDPQNTTAILYPSICIITIAFRYVYIN